MINYEIFTTEQKLLLLTSRLTFTVEEKKLIDDILTKHSINWFEFIKFALYHKTVTLCFHNLERYFSSVSIPKYILDIIPCISLGIKYRNTLFQQEAKNIRIELKKSNVCTIPVKGVLLIPNMYKDFGIRYSGDIDFLIKYEDINLVEKTTASLGYTKGFFDIETNTIKLIPRAEDIKWKVGMSNLYPFRKISGNEYFPFFKLDFRYALDDSLSKEPINEIINTAIEIGKSKEAHIFTHLCTHFYDEAKHSISIFNSKDLNLIKFCDIREYILQFMNQESINECVSFAKKHGLQKQIYFTVFLLKMVYNDGFEDNILNKLEIIDTDFINRFGENEKSSNSIFQKDFYERLFSCNNADELDNSPKFLDV